MKEKLRMLLAYLIVAVVSFFVLLFAERMDYNMSNNAIVKLSEDRDNLQSAIDKTQYQSAELMLKEKEKLKNIENSISVLTGEVSETPNFWKGKSLYGWAFILFILGIGIFLPEKLKQ
jgi:hypothetical protein